VLSKYKREAMRQQEFALPTCAECFYYCVVDEQPLQGFCEAFVINFVKCFLPIE